MHDLSQTQEYWSQATKINCGHQRQDESDPGRYDTGLVWDDPLDDHGMTYGAEYDDSPWRHISHDTQPFLKMDNFG